MQHRTCSTARTRCVILVEEAGESARIAPPEAILCKDAELHAKQMTADAPERKAWVQEILVTDEINPAKDCLGPEAVEQGREGIPWQDAQPLPNR